MNMAQPVQSYLVESFDLVPAFMLLGTQPGIFDARTNKVRKGARIFDGSAPFTRAYTVASGEVLVERDGRLIDIVEAGELLDPRIWGDATAIAYTDCTLTAPTVGI